MKKLVFLSIALFTVASLQAQNIAESAVPIAVTKTFGKMYPNVKLVKWNKEEADYEAEFKENNTEETATFDGKGKFLQSEKIIAIASLPKAATDYLAKNLPGKKIKEASEIKSADGVITYEAEINEVDYTFDANGNFLKQEEDED
jgi:hypothetical protein